LVRQRAKVFSWRKCIPFPVQGSESCHDTVAPGRNGPGSGESKAESRENAGNSGASLTNAKAGLANQQEKLLRIMNKEVGIVCIHGMGETEFDYYAELKEGLMRYLKEDWERVAFHPIYYQHNMQINEERVWDQMERGYPLMGKQLRKFFLFSFGDAAVLEYTRNQPGGAYEQVQKSIFEVLRRLRKQLGATDVPIVVFAHSLGCQVISNYVYDAQKIDDPAQGAGKRRGIWQQGKPVSDVGLVMEPDWEPVVRLLNLRYLITTGCNIPLFTAGMDRIIPFAPRLPGFQWLNFFDRQDVLGWPLQPLSPDYARCVQDIEINAGNILQAWNPLSHNAYWSDRDFLKPAAEAVSRLLAPRE
jgi:hypothetical protein